MKEPISKQRLCELLAGIKSDLGANALAELAQELLARAAGDPALLQSALEHLAAEASTDVDSFEAWYQDEM